MIFFCTTWYRIKNQYLCYGPPLLPSCARLTKTGHTLWYHANTHWPRQINCSHASLLYYKNNTVNVFFWQEISHAVAESFLVLAPRQYLELIRRLQRWRVTSDAPGGATQCIICSASYIENECKCENDESCGYLPDSDSSGCSIWLEKHYTHTHTHTYTFWLK